MSITADIIVVGSGLTGATISRVLADHGFDVLVLERRNHCGGNVHDHVHPSGIRIHSYGPHYFRTNSDEIWRFVNRFGSFFPYEAMVKTEIDGFLENWPVNQEYIRRAVGRDWKPRFQGTPRNFEEASLAMMPLQVYEKFVKSYTEKQWGVPAHSLSRNLAARFEVRDDNNPRFSQHRFQGIPRHGYAELIRNMLRSIPILLNFDYITNRGSVMARKFLVFTGAIDEFFSYDLGFLQYRAQFREHRFVPDVSITQPCGQVNNPDPARGTHIRSLEWKHMMPLSAAPAVGTLITREYPVPARGPDEYEYPFPDERNGALYRDYRTRASTLANVLICGRLGEYRYLDMDQAIGRGLRLARRIVLGLMSNTSAKYIVSALNEKPARWRLAEIPNGRT